MVKLLYIMKNTAADAAVFPVKQLLAFLLSLGVLALLVCNTAAGLASRLAGGLAFAAAAALCALNEITGTNGLDVFHNSNPPYG